MLRGRSTKKVMSHNRYQNLPKLLIHLLTLSMITLADEIAAAVGNTNGVRVALLVVAKNRMISISSKNTSGERSDQMPKLWMPFLSSHVRPLTRYTPTEDWHQR